MSLSAPEYTEYENTSSVTVTVMRNGDMDSTASVRLQTAQLEIDNPALGWCRNVLVRSALYIGIC